jgi:phosphoribosyl-AMP cyclohydrolase
VTDKPPPFALPGSTEEVEEGQVFSPKFDAHGLVTCVVADARTGEVLMVAHMNAVALAKTIETGDAWFYSRSRSKLWKKGETSGHVQRVMEMRVDCDQDALLLKVEQHGPGACHTGRRSCFYRSVPLREPAGQAVSLAFAEADRAFDPSKVYGKPLK